MASIPMAISAAFPRSHFIASAYISSSEHPPHLPPPPPHTHKHTPSPFAHIQSRGSQQGEGQLRGDFNLSGKIHIKPLMPAFAILSLPSPALSPPWHQSLLPSSPPSSSSARHLIQITELDSVSLCLEPLLCLADGQETTRRAVQARTST